MGVSHEGCALRPETYENKKPQITQITQIFLFFALFFPIFLSSQLLSFPLFVFLCVSLWLKLGGGFWFSSFIEKERRLVYNGKGETMSEVEIKKIPYAITDYDLIRRGNYYYVDKTRFIPIIEDTGRYLFLIRPRRFGKSLFIYFL